MTARTASCRCGQLSATCTGDPVRISVCHCLDCQRRSGSAFSAQARWPDAQVAISGERKAWECVGDNARRATFLFCPNCGGTIAYTIEALPGLTAVPVGAFADPHFPAPTLSVYQERKHAWVEVTGTVEQFD